jgi:hypothetical protein
MQKIQNPKVTQELLLVAHSLLSPFLVFSKFHLACEMPVKTNLLEI